MVSSMTAGTMSMVNSDFCIKPLPKVHFGVGKRTILPQLLQGYGKNVMLLTGGSSFTQSPFFTRFQEELTCGGVILYHEQIDSEPSPERVDTIVGRYRKLAIHVVVAIGGGSVLDGGKAVSAMLASPGKAEEFLEGVGSRAADGKKIPFVAMPTTSGTGSEATSNAVLSRVGVNGYKKSLRHDNYVPDIAIIDPELMLSCPPHLTARCAMDAFTQLVESYLSIAASRYTDDLAWGALHSVQQSILSVCTAGDNIQHRSNMAYAAFCSGVALTNSGLGAVHGLAGVLGGYCDLPHGQICGSLMAQANAVTLRKLRENRSNDLALAKYARLGHLFCGKSGSDEYLQDCFIAYLTSLSAELGLEMVDFSSQSLVKLKKIVAEAGSKNNPADLGDEEFLEILVHR